MLVLYIALYTIAIFKFQNLNAENNERIFKVHRLINFKCLTSTLSHKNKNNNFENCQKGSTQSDVNHFVALISNTSKSNSLFQFNRIDSRNIPIISLSTLLKMGLNNQISFLNSLIFENEKKSDRIRIGALLFVIDKLPYKHYVLKNDFLIKLEEYFLKKAFDIPIYFTVSSENGDNIFENLESSLFFAQKVQTVNNKFRENKNVQRRRVGVLTNLFLRFKEIFSGGLSIERRKNEKIFRQANRFGFKSYFAQISPSKIKLKRRSILIVANLDYWTMLPTLGPLSFSTNLFANSDLISAFILMRHLGKFQSQQNENYDLNFLFTSESNSYMLNYAGTFSILSEKNLGTNNFRLPENENVDFVFCLDRIGDFLPFNIIQKSIYLHVSRTAKDEFVQTVYENIKKIALKHNLNITVQQRKIDVRKTRFGFQHELFSLNKYFAMTLSSRQNCSVRTRSLLFNNDNIDYTKHIDDLQQVIYFIAESILRSISSVKFNEKSVDEQQNDRSIQLLSHFNKQWETKAIIDEIRAWNNFLSKHPRYFAFMNDDNAKNNIVLQHIERYLTKFSSKQTSRFIDLKELGLISRSSFNLHRIPALKSPLLPSPAKLNFVPIKFFEDYQNQIEMRLYKIQKFEFDLCLSFAILTYFFIIYIVIKAPKSFSDFKRIFS